MEPTSRPPEDQSHDDDQFDGAYPGDAIAAYVSGNASLSDRDRVQRWLTAAEPNQSVFRHLRSVWTSAARPSYPGDVRRFIQELRTRRRESGPTPVAPAPAERTRRLPRTFGNGSDFTSTPRFSHASWAVGLVCVIGVVLAGFALVQHGLRGIHTESEHAVTMYETRIGQRATVTLGDGSRVTLGPASRLSISTFDDAHRNVTLVGEAYFEVAERVDAPFVVSASGVTARVLGTAFAIRAYGKKTISRVTVASGKVVVQPGEGRQSADIVLTSAMSVQVDSIGTVRVERDVNVASYFGLIEGRLVFQGTPASDVLEELSRWYGLQFQLTDPNAHALLLDATFDVSETPEQVIRSIALMLHCRPERRGDVVILHGE